MRHTAAVRSTSIVSLVALVALVAACADGPDTTSDVTDSSAPTLTAVIDQPTNASAGAGTDAPAGTVGEPSSSATTDFSVALPVRDGPRERTTESVPHVQLDAVLVPEVDAELRRRAFAIPGVEDVPSQISLPGALGLSFGDEVELARPDVLLSGREFAHIHPDGSLHVWMPVERAVEVDATGWGELHPWVDREDFWDGVAMVFTPRTIQEVDIVIQLLVEAYNLVSGLDLDPNEF